MDSRTMLTLARSVATIPPRVAPLAYALLHSCEECDLAPVAKRGLIQSLLFFGNPVEPPTRTVIALATLTAISKSGLHGPATDQAISEAWSVIDECEARRDVEAALNWWRWVLATVGGSGSTLH